MTPVLRLGVVGCGRATCELHLPALKHVPALSVSALCDTSEEALARALKISGSAAGYADYRALVADPNVDVVAVCVPPRHHLPVAMAALDAGKPVYIEKPLALSVVECDQLVDRAVRLGVPVQVGFNLRAHRLVQQSRRSLESADGFRLIRSVFSAPTRLHGPVPAWRDDLGFGGDVLFEIAVHHFDLWRYLMKTEVRSVSSIVQRHPDTGSSVVVSATLANGALASAVFSDAGAPRNEIELLGPAGRIRIDLHCFDGLETMTSADHGGDLGWRGRRFLGSVAALPRALLSKRFGGDYRASYRDAWRHFAHAASNGVCHGATIMDGRMSTAIVDAMLQSIRDGRSVAVDS